MDLIQEIIAFVGGITVFNIDPEEFKSIQAGRLRKLDVDTIPENFWYLNRCFKELLLDHDDDHYVFNKLNEHNLECVINAANHLFALFQFRLILNVEVLNYLHGIYKYYQDRMYHDYWHSVILQIRELEKKKAYILTPKEFDKMTVDTQTMIEKNLDFAYSNKKPKELLKIIHGLI